MRRIRGWLSPGTVLAFIALVVALGGTGYAATGRAPSHDGNAATKKKKKSHTLTSSSVKKIADAEIQKLAPKLSVASAKSATTATTANSANTAKIATNLLSANVRSDGSMLGSIPAGATSSRAALGDYRVSFNRSLAGCTIAAAAANNTGPQLAFVAVGVTADPSTLQVFTRAPTNTVTDEPFYVQVICPA